MGHNVFIFVCLIVVMGAHGFNYGYHYDGATQALRYAGFGETSAKILALGDIFVDYFNYLSLKSINFSQYHADSLVDRDAVVRYWVALAKNARKAIVDVASDSSIEKRELKTLTLIGITLHSIQDFYAHSNWAEIHPRLCSCYRVETLFHYFRNNFSSSLPDYISTGKGSSYTGEYDGDIHGNPCSGRNKDSYVRPLFEEAYVFAYVASIEWINAVRLWINDDTFWNELQNFKDYEELENDLYLTSQVFLSLIAEPKLADSIYKGPGDGDILAYAYYMIKYITTSDTDMIKLLRKDKIYESLESTDLYENEVDVNDPQNALLVPALNDTVEYGSIFTRAVVIYITNASKVDSDGSKLFAKLKINSVQNSLVSSDFLKNVQMRDSTVRRLSSSNSATPWTNMIFVPNDQTTLDLSLELWEDARYGDGKQLDILSNKDAKSLTFTFNLATGQITGDVIGSGNTTLSSKGDAEDSGEIYFFIELRELLQNNTYYGPGSCKAYTLQECFTGLQHIGGEAYLCTDEGNSDFKRRWSAGLVAIILPAVVFLVLIIVIPIIICRVKHKCCFKKKYSKDFELDDF